MICRSSKRSFLLSVVAGILLAACGKKEGSGAAASGDTTTLPSPSAQEGTLDTGSATTHADTGGRGGSAGGGLGSKDEIGGGAPGD